MTKLQIVFALSFHVLSHSFAQPARTIPGLGAFGILLDAYATRGLGCGLPMGFDRLGPGLVVIVHG